MLSSLWKLLLFGLNVYRSGAGGCKSSYVIYVNIIIIIFPPRGMSFHAHYPGSSLSIRLFSSIVYVVW